MSLTSSPLSRTGARFQLIDACIALSQHITGSHDYHWAVSDWACRMGWTPIALDDAFTWLLEHGALPALIRNVFRASEADKRIEQFRRCQRYLGSTDDELDQAELDFLYGPFNGRLQQIIEQFCDYIAKGDEICQL